MNLIQLVNAGFKRVGIIAYNLQAAIALKQDKLPTNGTSGQFLAHDFTFKTPASSGGQPPWVDLAVLTANNFASGFPDGTNKLQIAKDTKGYIWVCGVFRNTSASPNPNLAIAIPTAYTIRQVNTGTTVATPLLLINSNSSAAGRPTSTFYITGSQFFGLTTGSYDASGTYIIPPTAIGLALNP